MFDLLLEDCAFRRRKIFLFVFGKDSKQINAFVFFEVDITDADTAALSTMLIRKSHLTQTPCTLNHIAQLRMLQKRILQAA